MNASSFSGAARTVAVVLILLVAAAAGLAVGNLIQSISGDRSITANATFSRAALDDLHALRTEASASVAQDYVDYAQRHATATQPYRDFGLRHPTVRAPLSDTFRLTGPSDVEAPAGAPMTDTFRLTGPSDIEGTVLRGQRKAN